MIIEKIVCPHCGARFTPSGAFMLEKCFCPVCRRSFYVLRGGTAVRFVYSTFALAALFVLYDIVRPETSAVIAVFWGLSVVFLKILAYTLHFFMLITYRLWCGLFKK